MQRSRRPHRLFPLLLVVVWPVLVIATCRGENWSQFRGDDGSGTSSESNFPRQWSQEQIRWNVELPGVGHSSPVIWGNKLFLTSANEAGTTRYVLCLDAQTGKRIWTREMSFKRSHKHPKNSWASSTPAVDGERVYVVFADSERQVLSAYDFEGHAIWEQDLGPFKSQHAQGTSPTSSRTW